MGLFHRATPKELLELRNKIFLDRGVPALESQGFIKSPFAADWFGRNNLKDFSYSLGRVAPHSILERITVHISRGDKWIKISLNIFELSPEIISVDQLKKCSSLQYGLPPNSRTDMRLRADDTKGMPLFRMLFGKEHKLGGYNSKSGLKREAEKLAELIERDMLDIDRFVKRWHELYQPNFTDWDGSPLSRAI